MKKTHKTKKLSKINNPNFKRQPLNKKTFKRSFFKRNYFKRNIAIIILVLLALLVFEFKKADLIKQSEFITQDDGNLMGDGNQGTEKAPIDKGITIVVDPGHGGRDPGKIGVNGGKEKDINLSISLKLRNLLEDNGYNVIMTRDDDVGLYNDSDSNKHVADLRRRVDIINNSNTTLAISIHQNSFQQESSKGAQVFYYSTSQESEIFANLMQEQIKMVLQPENKRLAKADTSYYVLKNTNCPTIIVECGFLTNNEEACLLMNEDYQEQMAEAIYLGLDTYMKVRD